jgi:hypothetical protein
LQDERSRLPPPDHKAGGLNIPGLPRIVPKKKSTPEKSFVLLRNPIPSSTLPLKGREYIS